MTLTGKVESKEDLIIEMLLTLCGRNLEISFSETRDFADKYEELKTKEASSQ